MNLFKENLSRLQETHPHLIEPLRAASPLPERELETLDVRQVVETHFRDPFDAAILNGLGTGALGLVLSQKYRKPLLVLSSLRELRSALEYTDLRPLLEFAAFTLTDESVALQQGLRTFLSRCEFATVLVYSISDAHLAHEPEIQVALNFHRVALQTLIDAGEEFEQNAVRNLAYRDSLGVDAFQACLRGRTAVVIGAGPSLTEALPELRRRQDDTCLVAVGRALRPLVQAGVQPHFVVSLDYSNLVEQQFDLEIPERTRLVYDADSRHTIPARFPAHRRITYGTSSSLSLWSAPFMGDRGRLERSLSVGHSAYFFASLMSPDRIVMIGLDCAYPDDRIHAEGVVTYRDQTEGDGKPVWVESVRGDRIRSDAAFSAFIPAFELAIRNRGDLVVNASPIGARIRGTREEALPSALGPVGSPLKLPDPEPPAFDAGSFIMHRIQVSNDLYSLGDSARRGLQLLDKPNRWDEVLKIRDLLRTPSETSSLLERILTGTVRKLRVLTIQGETSGKNRREVLRAQCRVLFTDVARATKLLYHWLRDLPSPVRESSHA
jgi:hypothetical protein